MKHLSAALLVILLFGACQKNENLTIHEEPNDLTDLFNFEKYLEVRPLSYQSRLPAYLKAVGMNDPVISDSKAALGRVLFYDKTLSRDQKISCATCHQQKWGFADAWPFSFGVNNQASTRNTPALGNTANFAAHYTAIQGVAPKLAWDEHGASVAEVSRQAITNPREMDMTMPEVVDRVAAQPYYPYLWRAAYGNTEVTEARILECLDAFVGSISAYDSKFDRALEQTSGKLSVTDTIVTQIYYGGPSDTTIITSLPFFSANAFRGLKLFVDHCSKCHSPIRPFQEVFMACNGLDLEYNDKGLGQRTGNPADIGVFKSPSLRNIALTAPYMHDGRLKTLKDVVEFYSTGVQEHPNLHPAMRSANGSAQLNFTEQEKTELIAFLHTLTDPTLALDERFSNPFK